MLLLFNSLEFIKSYLVSENRTNVRAEKKEIKASCPTNALINTKKNEEHSKYLFDILADFALDFVPPFSFFIWFIGWGFFRRIIIDFILRIKFYSFMA